MHRVEQLRKVPDPYRRHESSLYRKQNVRESISYDRFKSFFPQPPKDRLMA